MMKKAIAVFLSAVLTAVLISGCGGKGGTVSGGDKKDPITTASSVVLAYCANDSLNPYKCKTIQNRYLAGLLYDPLIKLSDKYVPEYCLAESASVTEKACTVKLKSAKFSDGSPLTAADVVYSASLAINSDAYKSNLSNISSVTESSGSVVFTLKSPDLNFLNLLDFPIIKNNTGDLSDNANLELPPVGCGRYTFDKSQVKLVRRSDYHGTSPVSETIDLNNIPDKEALKYAVTYGKISVWYDSEADNNALIINGGTDVYTKNTLTYIGMNFEDSLLSRPETRYMINAAFDRKALSEELKQSFIVPAYGIFNPSWEAVSSLQSDNDSGREDVLVANSKEIGYNKKDSDGYFVSSSGKRLSFTLLYCNESAEKISIAETLKAAFAKSGIELVTKGLSFNDYAAALASGSFQLYLAQTRFKNNMDVSSVVCTYGSLAYGLKNSAAAKAAGRVSVGASSEAFADASSTAAGASSSPSSSSFPSSSADGTSQSDGKTEPAHTIMDTALAAYNRGDLDIYDVAGVFSLQLPVIPISYGCGVLSHASGITGTGSFSPSDPYLCISSCAASRQTD